MIVMIIDVAIKTTADKLSQYVTEKKEILSEKAAKNLGIDIDRVEEWARVLEEHGIISIDYSPTRGMILKAKVLKKKEAGMKLGEIRKRKESLKEIVAELEKTIEKESEQNSEIEHEFIAVSERIEARLKKTGSGVFGGLKAKLSKSPQGKPTARSNLLGLQEKMKKIHKDLIVLGEERKKLAKAFKELKHDVSVFAKKVKKLKGEEKPKQKELEKIMELLSKVEAELNTVKDGKAKFSTKIKEIDGKIDAVEASVGKGSREVKPLKTKK